MSFLQAIAALSLNRTMPFLGTAGSADVQIRKDKRRSYVAAKREARARRNRRMHGGRR